MKLTANPESLTGVGVWPAGVGGGGGGGAVRHRGAGGHGLGAGVRPLAELVGPVSDEHGGGGVGQVGDAEGRLGELWRSLLVQLHRFSHCSQKHQRRRRVTYKYDDFISHSLKNGLELF